MQVLSTLTDLPMIPGKLEEVLHALTKENLDAIRKNAGLSGLSGLKKAELVRRLAEELPVAATNIFDLWDENRAGLMRKTIAKQGVLRGKEIDLAEHQLQPLVYTGLWILSRLGGQVIIAVPAEIMESFKRYDTPEYRERVRQNTLWVKLMEGMLYYYGAIGHRSAQDMIALLTGVENWSDRMQIWHVLHEAAPFSDIVSLNSECYYDSKIEDPQRLINEQESRKLGFYLYNVKQLLAATELTYVDPTTQATRLVEFFTTSYQMSRDDARLLVNGCRWLYMMENRLDPVLREIERCASPVSMQQSKEMVSLLVEFLNNTPHWVTRGHTPAVLAQNAANDSTKYKNVRRNDPCPCGSGRKYKQCCIN